MQQEKQPTFIDSLVAGLLVMKEKQIQQDCKMYCGSGESPLCFYDGSPCKHHGDYMKCQKYLDITHLDRKSDNTTNTR